MTVPKRVSDRSVRMVMAEAIADVLGPAVVSRLRERGLLAGQAGANIVHFAVLTYRTLEDKADWSVPLTLPEATAVRDLLDAVRGELGITRALGLGEQATRDTIKQSDLDRCRHGRHAVDNCFYCPDGWSTGNLYLDPHQRIGTDLGGSPILVGDVRRHARDGDPRTPPPLKLKDSY